MGQSLTATSQIPRAPVKLAKTSDASSRLVQSLDRAGRAVQHALEDNRLSLELKAVLAKTVAPFLEHLRSGAEALAKFGGERADRLARAVTGSARSRLRRLVGEAIHKFFGADALRHTSVTLSENVRVSFAGLGSNTGVFLSEYLPSLAQADANGGYAKAAVLNYGADVATRVGGLAWNKRAGVGRQVNLFFLNASSDSKSVSVFIGIPGIFGLTLGQDVQRGSFVSVGSSIPLTPLGPLGPRIGGSIDLYSPGLDPVTEHVTRPLAEHITHGVQVLSNAAHRTADAIKHGLGLGEQDGLPDPA